MNRDVEIVSASAGTSPFRGRPTSLKGTNEESPNEVFIAD